MVTARIGGDIADEYTHINDLKDLHALRQQEYERMFITVETWKWPYSFFLFFFFFWLKKHLNALLFTLQFWAGLDVKEPLVIRCSTPTCLFWEDGDRFVLALKDFSFDSTGCSSKVMADEEEEDEPEDEDEPEGQWKKREDEGIAGLLGILIGLLPIRLITLLAVSVRCGDSEVVLLVDTSSWSLSTTCFSIAKAWEFSCTLSDMRSVAAVILSSSRWTFSELRSMQLVARCNVFRNSFRPSSFAGLVWEHVMVSLTRWQCIGLGGAVRAWGVVLEGFGEGFEAWKQQDDEEIHGDGWENVCSIELPSLSSLLSKFSIKLSSEKEW